MKFTGGCYCGKIRYEISSEPKAVVHCHCNNCKRSVGGPFVTWAVFNFKDLVFTQGTTSIHVTDNKVERGFCDSCGSSISYGHKGADTIDITAGTLDDPNSLDPSKHIWDKKRIQWVKMDDNLPHYAEWSQDNNPIKESV